MSDFDCSDKSAPVELSEQELDQIAGGFDVVIAGAVVEQEVAVQQTTAEIGNGVSASSTNYLSRTSGTIFQFVGTGFSSMKDVFSVLSSFNRLLGR